MKRFSSKEKDPPTSSSSYLPENEESEGDSFGSLYVIDGPASNSSSYLTEGADSVLSGSQYSVVDEGDSGSSSSKYLGSNDEEASSSRSGSCSSSEEEAVQPEELARKWMDEIEIDTGGLQSFFGSLDQWAKLADVYHDFSACAKHFGRTIISEMHLPDAAKTIKPISIGGVAGGRKYLHANMIFKFAQDAQLSDGSFMYGGVAPDLEKANKACGHEVKSCSALALAAVELGLSHLLHVPLMALVRYRGNCLVAIAMLPVSKQSLVLGSNDGNTCVNTDREAEELTGLVCSYLGLEPHSVNKPTKS
jgi:hypothetical protein